MVVPVRKVTLAAAVVMVGMLATAAPASACSCVPLSEDSIQRGEAAIVAKLISIEPRGDESAGTVRADFRFEVLEVLKGEKRVRRDEIAVRSFAGDTAGAACGLSDRVGKRSGLVITRRRHRWTGTSCSQTTPGQLRDLLDGRRSRISCEDARDARD